MPGDGAGRPPGDGSLGDPKPGPPSEPTESSLSQSSTSPADTVNWKCKLCYRELAGTPANTFAFCPFCGEVQPQEQGDLPPEKTSAVDSTKLLTGTPTNTDPQSITKGKANSISI